MSQDKEEKQVDDETYSKALDLCQKWIQITEKWEVFRSLNEERRMTLTKHLAGFGLQLDYIANSIGINHRPLEYDSATYNTIRSYYESIKTRTITLRKNIPQKIFPSDIYGNPDFVSEFVSEDFEKMTCLVKLRMTMAFFACFDFFTYFICSRCVEICPPGVDLLEDSEFVIPGISKIKAQRRVTLYDIFQGNPYCVRHKRNHNNPYEMISVGNMFKAHPSLVALWNVHGGKLDANFNPLNFKEMLEKPKTMPFYSVNSIQEAARGRLYNEWFELVANQIVTSIDFNKSFYV